MIRKKTCLKNLKESIEHMFEHNKSHWLIDIKLMVDGYYLRYKEEIKEGLEK